MKITNSASAHPIVGRHLLPSLLAASVVACAALRATAQEDNVELNPDTVPTNTVIATIPLGGVPTVMVINKQDSFVYVVNSLTTISQIDSTKNSVVNTWSAGPNPTGLAITPDGKQLYVGNTSTSTGTVTILDASTGSVVKTIALAGSPVMPQISPNGKFAWVPANLVTPTSNTGSVTVIDTATQTIKTTIPMGQSAFDVVFNRRGTLAYVTDSDDNSVAVINTATFKAIQTVALATPPTFAIFSPATHDVFVLDSASISPIGYKGIAVIQGHTVIKNLTVPSNSSVWVPAITPNGKYAYVPQTFASGAGSVYLMDTTTYNTVGTSIQVGNRPYLVAITHSGKRAYVSNSQDQTISVIKISPAQ
jgi:YVTN family beta-propeller protein